MNPIHKVGSKWAILEGEAIFKTEAEATAAYLKWATMKDSSFRRRMTGQKHITPNMVL